MQAIVLPGEPAPRQELKLATRRGTQIVNSQTLAPVIPFYCHLDADLRKTYPNAVIRSGPSAVYNCHGLTFASRRTTIWQTTEIRKILKEDDYEEVGQEHVLPGDIVLYKDKETGDIEHSGIVVSKHPDELNIIRVVSKWGHCSETVHPLGHCCYNAENVVFYRVKK